MKAKIRPAAKAGTWYEGSPEGLKKQLEGFFQKPFAGERPSPVRALISPHAGYLYSGPTAGIGYGCLQGQKVKRVIVLAPSHYARFDGGSILDVSHYETPLGRIPLDRKACAALRELDYFTCIPGAHSREHSLELQLPFLQHILEEPFELVPVVIGHLPDSWAEPIAEALLPYWDDDTLIVASSDFTHYGSGFNYLPFEKNIPENLKKLDLGAVEKIEAIDAAGFEAYVQETGATICGRKPISLLLRMAAARGLEGKLLDYTTSGAMTGDFSTSVSYVSFCFFGSGKDRTESGDTHALTEDEQATVLRLARHTLKTFLKTGQAPKDLAGFDLTPALHEELGAFVTLKKENRLRGCIGYLRGVKPLYMAIIDNTISAASKDPRFSGVVLAEESSLHIEVSVLSPVVAVQDLEEIKVGRDGLIISRGFQRGTLLPQVPVELGWNRKEFLENTCRKAGLPLDAYLDEKTLIERYAAQVFSEPK